MTHDTGQSDAAAERSAHVLRDAGPQLVAVHPVVEVSPGVWRLRAVVEAEAARDAARDEVASLRLTLGGRTLSADVPEPIGCPCPGACSTVAEIVRLRDELQSMVDAVEAARDERDAARAQGKRAGLGMAALWHDTEAESCWQRAATAHGAIEHQQARERARLHDEMAEAMRSMADAALGPPSACNMEDTPNG